MSAEMGLKQELTVAYPAKDRKGLVEFYGKHFGWTMLYDVEEIGWCEMKTHIENVYVGFAEREDPKFDGGGTLTWGTTDIDAARKYLEGNGVKFAGDTVEIPGMVKLATFYDPDGNHVMLAQSLSQGQQA
jgi:predicted enzyme related to lactoylglutathione lyase